MEPILSSPRERGNGFFFRLRINANLRELFFKWETGNVKKEIKRTYSHSLVKEFKENYDFIRRLKPPKLRNLRPSGEKNPFLQKEVCGIRLIR